MKAKKRFILFIILTIFFCSFLSFFLILNYLDPFEYKLLATILIILTFVLSLSSFFALVFYFFKKIYYRWEVFLSHVKSSFRQWFFISLFFVWIVFFKFMGVDLLFSSTLLFILLLFLELFIQNLETYNL